LFRNYENNKDEKGKHNTAITASAVRLGQNATEIAITNLIVIFLQGIIKTYLLN
jgi:hypothetical protein